VAQSLGYVGLIFGDSDNPSATLLLLRSEVEKNAATGAPKLGLQYLSGHIGTGQDL
jgi:hypothetical protein